MSKKLISLLLMLAFVLVPMNIKAEGEVNLALGLPYVVETGEPVTMSHANFSEDGVEFDDDKGQLTDGKVATASASADGWYRAFRSQSRIVSFDLGKECAVSAIEAGFLHAKAPGIYAPRYINVYLSADGVDYSLVKAYDTEYPLHDVTVSRCEFSVALDETYEARYVRVEFCCDIFAYCDEIRILGRELLFGNEKKPAPDEIKEPAGFFKSLGGVSDIIKLYNGYYQPDTSVGILTEEKLLPYVAYLDTDGNIAGKMFDSVALVPCHGDYPSGGRLVKTNGKPGAVMSDWELYFDYTFRDGQDLSALDSVVGRVYGELGLDEKMPVFLTLPYPTVIETTFGDINGDGVAEYCTTLDERVDIVKWFADKCIDAFGEKDYENLELAGFYWLREEINYSDSDHEAELVSNVNEYLTNMGLYTIFDPFYLSIGFDHWESLGFSGAVMQPNVAFDHYPYFELGMLTEFSQTVLENHLGVEIETNEPSAFKGDDYLKAGFNYESYLFNGYKSGYMNALKTYYQGANPGSIYDFCYADIKTPKGVYLRRLYDLTYSFIHGVYKNEPPVVSIDDIELFAGDKRSRQDIKITDADSYWGDISVEFTVEPMHGSVTAAAGNRTLIYVADDGFVGEDSFTLRVSDGFNYSEECVVKVTVSEPEIIEGSSATESTGDVSNQDDAKETAPVWIIISIVAVAIMTSASAVVLIKKKKGE
ncbi:MAG: DUF4855 domain-containing protein [Clostridia bacterium]|nr:DUF4855 domain-containing protein [Clostridia bacterium]